MRKDAQQEPEKTLRAGQAALAAGKSIYDDKLNWDLHALAEMQYEPAIPFFIACLAAKDDGWRLEAARNLGYHYPLRPDDDAVLKLRQLALHDPDDEVRMVAVSVLGIRSQWPEPVLLHSLEKDQNEFVRRSAFRSLLRLAGLPYPERTVVERQMKQEKAYPLSLEGLKQVLQRYEIEADWDQATTLQ